MKLKKRTVLLKVLACILSILLLCCSCKKDNQNFSSDKEDQSSLSGAKSGEEHMSILNNVDIKDTTLTPFERSVITYGDPGRVAGVLKKAERGEDITICVLGGSITQGAGSSNADELSWAALVRDWFKAAYQNINVTLVNAGIGATDSVYGVFRLEDDVIKYNPDLVVVEFCVNDRGVSAAKEAFEGIIRRLLSSSDQLAVISLATSSNQGESTQDIHTDTCRNYHVPFLSYWNAYSMMFSNGDIDIKECYSDALHPTDKGHAMLAQLLKDYLDYIKNKIDDIDTTPKSGLNPPITADRYENTIRYDNTTLVTTDKDGNDSNNKSGSGGWTLSTKNPTIKFSVENAYIIHIGYTKTPAESAGKIRVLLNGVEASDPIDSYFKDGWGSYYCIGTILDIETSNSFEVEITLDTNDKENARFWISNILVASKK